MQQLGDIRFRDGVVGQQVVVCGGDELVEFHLAQLCLQVFQWAIFLGQQDYADNDDAHAHGKTQGEPERRGRGAVIVVIRVNERH